MYDFMYVDPETMPVEAYFPATKTFIENNNKMSTPRPVSKHFLGFVFIRSEFQPLFIAIFGLCCFVSHRILTFIVDSGFCTFYQGCQNGCNTS